MKKIKRRISRRFSRGVLGNLRRKAALLHQRDFQAIGLECSTAELLARQYQPGGFSRLDLVVMYLAIGESYGHNTIGFSLLAKLLERDPSPRKVDQAFQLFLEGGNLLQEVFIPAPVGIDSEMNLAHSAAGLALALYRREPEVTVTVLGKQRPACYDAEWFRSHGFSHDEIAAIEQARQDIFDGYGLRSIPWNEVRQLQQEMRRLLYSQPQDYGRSGFYQSCEELLVPGQRPTAVRFQAYDLARILKPGDRVLDIGCNCGFFALKTARHVAAVEAFDINPSLIGIARLAAAHLDITNCRFRACSFEEFSADEPYDVVFSFAVHHWIGLPIEEYATRLLQIVKPGGLVLFESHDLTTLDGDWDAQLAVVCAAGLEVVENGTLCDDGLFVRRYALLRSPVPASPGSRSLRAPFQHALMGRDRSDAAGHDSGRRSRCHAP